MYPCRRCGTKRCVFFTTILIHARREILSFFEGRLCIRGLFFSFFVSRFVNILKKKNTVFYEIWINPRIMIYSYELLTYFDSSASKLFRFIQGGWKKKTEKLTMAKIFCYSSKEPTASTNKIVKRSWKNHQSKEKITRIRTNAQYSRM